ncbi:MAG: cupin domain-containing protein [Actinomycetota bacterium]
MVDDELAGRLGAGIRSRRTERRWTLDEASERLGVSRRLLVRIEQGDANPSLSTLLRVASGFGIGLSELLPGGDRPAITVATRSEATGLWSTPAGSSARLLVSTRELELWEWTLAPGDVRSSEAHRTGSQEVLTVATGELLVEVDGEERHAGAGTSVALVADRPHRYRNDGDRPCHFTMAVYEPVDGATS